MPRTLTYILPALAESHRAFDEYVQTLPRRTNTGIVTNVDVFPADAVRALYPIHRREIERSYGAARDTGLLICSVRFTPRSRNSWTMFEQRQELQFFEDRCVCTIRTLGEPARLRMRELEHELYEELERQRFIKQNGGEYPDPPDCRMEDGGRRYTQFMDSWRPLTTPVTQEEPPPLSMEDILNALENDPDRHQPLTTRIIRTPEDLEQEADSPVVSLNSLFGDSGGPVYTAQNLQRYREALNNPNNPDDATTYLNRLHREHENRPTTRNRERPRDSYREYQEMRREHGNMVTPAQQRAALRRRAEEEAAEQTRQARFRIDWENTVSWTCPGPDGEPATYEIVSMEDKHIWETTIWIVRDHMTLYKTYAEHLFPNLPPNVGAKHWLKAQPLFRSMLQETARRQMRFPPDVYDYLVKHVFGTQNATPVEEMKPWQNPEGNHQLGALAAFAEEPTVIDQPVDPVEEYGKDFRQIDL